MCIGLDRDEYLGRRHNTVLIFGGFRRSDENTEITRGFKVIDIDESVLTFRISGHLLKGDFFYYNQFTVDRSGRKLTALGIDHIHFIDLKDLKSTGIKENDGDYPQSV